MHGYVEVVDCTVENHETKCACDKRLLRTIDNHLCPLPCYGTRTTKAAADHDQHHLSSSLSIPGASAAGRIVKNNKQVKINCAGTSLDSVLNSVPLLYDPVTKQLFLNDHGPKPVGDTVSKSSASVANNGTPNLMGDGSTSFKADRVHCKCHSEFGAGDTKDIETKCVCKSHDEPSENFIHKSNNLIIENESTSLKSGQVDESDCNGCTDDAQFLPSPACFSAFTDTSSVTSISSISTGTEASVALSEYTENSDNAGVALFDSVSQCSRGSPWKGAKPKKKGLSSLLPRNLFPWKAKDDSDSLSTITSSSSPEISRRHTDDCVASSTTALILENRPAHLPAKSYEEEQKHKQEYEEMVKAARKKEIREAKMKKKQMQQLRKQEDMLIQTIKIWTDEILPQWDAVKDCRKTRDLWWQGIPPNVRGKVWKLAIGNDLNITPELFDICVTRSKEKIWTTLPSTDNECSSGETSADLIKLDVSRTFPVLGIFQESGPYHEVLSCVLGAYVTYRPDVGYVQGMSFLAAMLLLNMESVDAFTCFANLLNKPCQLSFFRVDEVQMKAYYDVYEDFFNENLPKLFAYFNKQNLSTDLYLIDWIYTLYSRSLPLDVASRVWDVFFRDGEEFIFRAALGILRMYEDVLLQLDFIHIAQFLNKLPDDICAEQLFASISAIRMSINKKQFSQTLLKRQAELASEGPSVS